MKASRTIRKIVGTLILAVGLSSCVPAALVLGATLGGAVVYDKRSMQTIAEDQKAGETAGAAIADAPELQKGTHIAIATFHHVLLLVGQTQTQEQRDLAYQLASKTKFVSRVYNEITIQKPTSTWQRSHDAWITTKIKTKMLARRGLHSTEIKVVTENNVVYLMGILSNRQAELATDVARHVESVTKVVKVFENPQ